MRTHWKRRSLHTHVLGTFVPAHLLIGVVQSLRIKLRSLRKWFQPSYHPHKLRWELSINHCAYCGILFSPAYWDSNKTRDHLVPQVHGGQFCVYACNFCNNLKMNAPLPVFLSDPLFRRRYRICNVFGQAMPQWKLEDLFRDEVNRIEERKWKYYAHKRTYVVKRGGSSRKYHTE